MKRLVQFLLIAASFGCASSAFCQATNSGDITGTVTDTTGAVLPDVTVSVLDVDKNDTHTFVTNQAGVYDTGSIIPDHYILTFTKQGFATYKRGPITVSVGLMGLNVQMTVGGTQQQVVVTSEAPLLETTTAELSSSIPSETLQELPQVGTPDWQGWTALQPGASGTPQGTLGAGMSNEAANPGMQIAANGSMPFVTSLMDGVTTNSPMSDNVIMTPIFDSIGEVKMIDSLSSAQYPVGGIIYNQITKGGTDHYHGMAYDYFQNDATDAVPYAFGTHSKVPLLRYNDIGGNFGGPTPLPYFNKRMFFFFAVERIINHAAGTTAFISVPSDAMKAGDFTGMPTIYDPTTQVINPGTGVVTRQSFASEYGNGNKIPSGMLSHVAQNLQKYFPAPTPGAGTIVNGIPTNNYYYQLPNTSPSVKYFGRFDEDVTSKNRLTGSAAYNDMWINVLTPVCPIGCVNIDVMNTNNQLSDVWTLTNSLVNEFRIGFMGEYDHWNASTLGMGLPSKAGLQFSKADVFPILIIPGEYALGTPGFNGFYKSNVFDLSDVVTLIRGRHDLHFGTEVLMNRPDSTAIGDLVSANMMFTGVYTAASQGAAGTTGTPYADFLMGYANTWNALVGSEYGGRLKSPQIFAQDDWKLNQNLTLNLGLRWIGTTGWSEIRGNELSFDPKVMNPATNTLGAMWYGTTHANGRTSLQKPIWNYFAPRAGFAYQFGTKTTIRGGYGIFTFPWSVDDYGAASQLGAGFLGAAKSSSGAENDSTGGVNPVVQLDSSGDVNYQGSLGASVNNIWHTAPTGADSYNGQQVNYAQYETPLARLQEWNLTVQRQLNQDMMASVAYVGSHGGNLLFFTDLNQVPESKLGPNDSGSRPYTAFQSIPGNVGEASSNYHSLQAVISQRMSHGLLFNFNYTWSKMLSEQDSAGWYPAMGKQPFQNAYVPSANYGPSNFDIRHMFKGQALYQLPFGKGRPFLNNNALLNEAIGGWSLSGTLVVQGGNPFTPTMATDLSYSLAQEASQYPNLVGNPKAQGSSGTVNEWFNVAAFASPGAGKFGNMRRNSVYGPGLTSFNAALHKTFPIRENVNFDFFAEATNVVNHPSFQQPDSSIGPGHIGQITAVTIGGRSLMFIGKIRF